MLLRPNRLVAGVAVLTLWTAAPVLADVDITGGNLRLLINSNANSSSQTPSLNLDRGYGTFTPGFHDRASAIYTLSDSSFQIHDIDLARDGADVAAATGTINFSVTENTFYTFDWNYDFASTDNSVFFASVEIQLKNLDTNTLIFYSYQTGVGAGGSLGLADRFLTPAEVSGLLTAGVNYQMYYNLNIVSYGAVSGPASADGSVSLIFSNTGNIPEPASLAMLAVAGCGLLFRRR